MQFLDYQRTVAVFLRQINDQRWPVEQLDLPLCNTFNTVLNQSVSQIYSCNCELVFTTILIQTSIVSVVAFSILGEGMESWTQISMTEVTADEEEELRSSSMYLVLCSSSLCPPSSCCFPLLSCLLSWVEAIQSNLQVWYKFVEAGLCKALKATSLVFPLQPG